MYNIKLWSCVPECTKFVVKGRVQGKPDVTVSHNEMKTAANAPDKCLLAVIVVDGNKRNVTYFANWIDRGPGFAETNRSLNLQKLRTAARVALEKEFMM